MAAEVTPIERHDGIYVKRDDLYERAGSFGGKVRTCWRLATEAQTAGHRGLVTAGSRHSPQVNIVASIAAALGLRCRVHVPAGPTTPELEAAAAKGAEVVGHRPGHNSVIVARARADALAVGWAEIPFGMECAEAVAATASQVTADVALRRRLVVPVGSGMSLAGILTGLAPYGSTLAPRVLGVVVGADPTRRLHRWAPLFWPLMVDLVPAQVPYGTWVEGATVGDVPLDPVYEAKCLPFLEPDDLLWVVGRRQTA